MKGSIAGIIAVFFLQVAVIGYGTVTRFFDAPVEVGSVASQTSPLPEISDSDFIEFEPDIAIDADLGNMESVAPSFAVSKRRTNSSSPKRSGFRTFDTQLKTVTINVPKPSPYAFAAYEPRSNRTEYPVMQVSDREPATYEASAKTVEVRGKRSFLSKTFGVIKKPYDWTRAAVMKLK